MSNNRSLSQQPFGQEIAGYLFFFLKTNLKALSHLVKESPDVAVIPDDSLDTFPLTLRMCKLEL